MAKRNKFGRTKAQQKTVDAIRDRGGIVPLTLFERSMTPEQLVAHQERLRSSATHPHGNPKARRSGTGHTSRVGSRSSVKTVAIRDF